MFNGNSPNKDYGIIYCPEYVSYFVYDKNKKSSKVRWFNHGIKVKYSPIELLSDPINWNGRIIKYQIMIDQDNQR
jgi:hypothetical protein